MAALTVRGKDQRWLTTHRFLTEDPPNSNRDNRADGITAAQKRLGAWLVGLPWCGVWAANGLLAAGVKGVNFRQASVAFIEDDARAGRAPFRDWQAPSEYRKVMRGDLVVLFGRGVHVETVRSFKRVNGQTFVRTDGGNTSSGAAGSQSNGGGSFPRWRPLSDVRGFARVDYPGGRAKAAQRLAMRASAASTPSPTAMASSTTAAPSSDRALLEALAARRGDDPDMFEFRDALTKTL
jgi:hypothetical protein